MNYKYKSPDDCYKATTMQSADFSIYWPKHLNPVAWKQIASV